MRLSLLIGGLLVIGLSGCTFAPLAIDVSQSEYKVDTSQHASTKPISRLEFRNTADDGKLVSTSLGSDTIYPIRPVTTTKQTVESDLRSFLNQRLPLAEGSPRSVVVNITKADSYWVLGGAAKAPLLGIALAGANTEFGLNIRILIEIEEGGKVVSSYLVDEKLTIQDRATDADAISKSYQRLIAEYRTKLFGELETRFVRRYL